MLNSSMLNSIATQLHNLAAGVQEATIDESYQVSIPFGAIHNGNRATLLEKLKSLSAPKGRYIYQFTVEQTLSETLHQAFKAAKSAGRNDRAYCRVNAASALLYVGSSTDLHSRIKQHLGFGNKGTYAMQLCHWLPELEGALNIQAWRFAQNVDNSVIQAIEDGLWALNRPMFGRQGAR
ncbi:hypothetical protein A210_16790 [Pseudomonas putida SJTE-1]|uniref:GIY-YIG nuclease family protein n=1 Tax=Pseudomonas putida TaxID=303 RepID=UPI0007DE10ED|nr:GIY-YIG nuclease family protein [Pseudomonas putida]ANI04237.1 hypothetical protein A210_16790 [Pseudomonas putida SJTE-1]WNI06467.1 GIY-YIG nuclease family protein [Pseudomonas putida]